MIVRINQIDAGRAPADGGWAAGPDAGWPADAAVFEVLVLSEDEVRQPMTDAFRRQQVRQLIPQVAIALAPPADSGGDAAAAAVVVRLDGPVAADELLPAWRYLVADGAGGRYGFAAAAKLGAAPPAGSVRLTASWRLLAHLCADPAVGMERSTRLRLAAGPADAVHALLPAAAGPDDPWRGGLPAGCHLSVGTTPGLGGLHVAVRRADAAQVRHRIMQRLVAVARGEPAVPA